MVKNPVKSSNIPEKHTESERASTTPSTPENTSQSSSLSGVFKKKGIDAIRESILLQEKTKAESRKELTIESVESVWKEYSEACTSKSVQMALQHTLFEVEPKTIRVYVPNQVTKDMVLQETNLLDQLRNELVIPDLIFMVESDVSRFPDYEENKFVPVLSQKDKYLAMVEKNPQLEKFTQKFGLKLDSGN